VSLLRFRRVSILIQLSFTGKLADLTILSQDIMSVPEDQLLATQAVMTIVGGQVVFER